MTTPIVRKRAKKPKTRTGCHTCRARHVKCDETKPVCQRCTKAGRTCDGYPAARTESHQKAPLLVLPKPVSSLVGTLTNQEKQILDFFRHKTAHFLPGSSFALSWNRLILNVGIHEPAVTHIAIALGSLHLRRHRNSGIDITLLDASHEEEDDFALAQCNKAMAHLRKNIDDGLNKALSSSSAEVVVLVSLLFFCFEVWSTREDHAGLHLRSGMRILCDYYRNEKPEYNDGRKITMEVRPRSTLALLLQTCVRLDHDLTLNHAGYDGWPFLCPIVREPLPVAFGSLDEAMVHLDALSTSVFALSRDLRELVESTLPSNLEDFKAPGSQLSNTEIRRCLSGTLARFMSLESTPQIAKDLKGCQRSVQQWMDALASVPLEPENEAAHIAAQLQFFLTWCEVTSCNNPDEMHVDRFEKQCVRMLFLAERYVNLHRTGPSEDILLDPIVPVIASDPSVFSLGTGLVACVGVLTLKCRASWVRRRCIKLLRSIDLSGVFDSYYVVSLMQTVVDLEESWARSITGMPLNEELQSEDIPREARMLDMHMGNMETPFYYKADQGLLIYAFYGPSGQILVDSTNFTVVRP